MESSVRFGALLVVAELLGAACVSGASADVILTYTGQDFTAVNSPYTTADKITGTIDLSSPLGDNLSLASVTPTSFSFSDGVQTIATANSSDLFEFSTNSSGMITAWDVSVQVSPPAYIQTEAGATTLDIGYEMDKDLGETTQEGSWSVQTTSTSVPEPLTLSLFGAGLIGAAAMRRRKAKKPV